MPSTPTFSTLLNLKPPPPTCIKICSRCQLSQRKVSIWRYRLIDILYFLFLLSNVGIRYFFFEVLNYSLLFHYRFPTLILTVRLMVTYRASPSHTRGGKRIDPRPRGLPNTSRRNGGHKTSFSGRDTNASSYRRPTILQLNIEGHTACKIGVIEQVASKHQALVVLIQETHCHNAKKPLLPGFALAGATLSRKHGIATFAQEKLSWILSGQSSNDSDIEWPGVDICGFKIINVYKPPLTQMTPTSIPIHPCLYAGNFNCQHKNWGYTNTNEDGSCLATWAVGGNLFLRYDPKRPASFLSGRWGS